MWFRISSKVNRMNLINIDFQCLIDSRLLQFLPMRLMQWQMIPSVLDVENKNSIEEIRIEIEQIKQRLTTLAERQRKLDEIIEQGKQLKANTDTEVIHFENIQYNISFS